MVRIRTLSTTKLKENNWFRENLYDLGINRFEGIALLTAPENPYIRSPHTHTHIHTHTHTHTHTYTHTSIYEVYLSNNLFSVIFVRNSNLLDFLLIFFLVV